MSMIETKVEELRSIIEATDEAEIKMLEGNNYRLSHAIRDGASVSKQAFSWGNGETACALSAAVLAAKARGYME